ncbi:group III truncated hemoglobin [Flavobacterium sp.]|uniref:group III truncated hemoglobin n=1 Tax=Flavobacterium sp. TaxID=239 RepID=UPI003D6B9F11
MKKDIQNREDLSFLVSSFYAKIKTNEEIGPFFNTAIKDWDAHMGKLTDFWENNLFAVRKYFGNPILSHQQVDRKCNYTINASAFGLWLNIWFETLNDLFEGENTETLKRRARKMGTVLLVAIYKNREEDYSSFNAQTNM